MWQKTFDCMPKPRYTDSFEAMAQCCVRMGDHESAVEYYKKELELLREDWGLKYGAEVDALEEKIRHCSKRISSGSPSKNVLFYRNFICFCWYTVLLFRQGEKK